MLNRCAYVREFQYETLMHNKKAECKFARNLPSAYNFDDFISASSRDRGYII